MGSRSAAAAAVVITDEAVWAGRAPLGPHLRARMARFRIRIPARSDLWSSFRFGHHCCQGWGWIGTGSNHGGRKFGPGAGAVSIGLAHTVAQGGPGPRSPGPVPGNRKTSLL